ncbi:MAG: hypothetical protein JWN73_4057 [Betaproteobacteria bacterium]|nr:hypothetical protein [Betaproteobacteria bacterium]
MSAADYAAFAEQHFAPYAAGRVLADHISQTEAEAFVRKQTAATLPQGQATAGHRFYNIVDAADTQVGSLWVRHAVGEREAFVFDLVVDPPFRRRDTPPRRLPRFKRC